MVYFTPVGRRLMRVLSVGPPVKTLAALPAVSGQWTVGQLMSLHNCIHEIG